MVAVLSHLGDSYLETHLDLILKEFFPKLYWSTTDLQKKIIPPTFKVGFQIAFAMVDKR